MDGSFTANAIIDDGESLRHRRAQDHESTLPDTRVVLDEPIGPYPAGTDLHTVLDWLWKKVVR